MEQWKEIECYGGRYSVSTIGRILNNKTGRLNKIQVIGTGYRTIGLTLNGKTKTHKVCKLVLETFIGPRPEGMVVCHGPGGKLNDSLANLSWGTRTQNNRIDRVRDGTQGRGESHGRHWITDEQVHQIRRWLADGKTQRWIAKQIGCHQVHVDCIKSGKSRQHLNTHGLWEWNEISQTGKWLSGRFSRR